ncbi:DUF2293 domain-containing protein [Pelagicoccus mobilis]|uniref:DUF2293 domain-containing protein n=1 Tax=Pelagicoccus mobilis TaxID=415221 RepID=A0A934RYL6_9BACT|nr:DUF2293 domain-containing protein [Pelagicoccus mobilis]MBK1880120.1 DUF2293 domain-containing protein [Pelagicoccus mobilis]
MNVHPHSHPRKVISPQGEVLNVPENWALLEPGDATLTRRVKAAGPTWTVKQKKGRRIISLGVWADKETIETERLRLLVERQDPAYKKRLQSGRDRRAKQEANYAVEFRQQVLDFLNFHSGYDTLAQELATRIADHAVPVGSGTVARTQRIPVEKRAEAATIAWMRHQTTAYDTMYIPRVKGQRRETRRRLAAESKRLLNTYRQGLATDPHTCPLQQALAPNQDNHQPTPPPPKQSQLEL